MRLQDHKTIMSTEEEKPNGPRNFRGKLKVTTQVTITVNSQRLLLLQLPRDCTAICKLICKQRDIRYILLYPEANADLFRQRSNISMMKLCHARSLYIMSTASGHSAKHIASTSRASRHTATSSPSGDARSPSPGTTKPCSCSTA